MHHSSIFALFVSLLCAVPVKALALSPPLCESRATVEVRSLTALPNEISELLGAKRAGLDGIADRNGKFNATDLIDDMNLPMHRFVVAKLADNCAVVMIEHGGRGHWFEVIRFELADAKWRISRRWPIENATNSPPEFAPSHNK